MAIHFNPVDGRLAIEGNLPSEFGASARLAEAVLGSVSELYHVTFMSWRETMDDAVAYLLLRDDRAPFVDKVAGLAVLRPTKGRGRIRLGFTREPATGDLLSKWTGVCPIVRREAAWRNAVQNIEDGELAEAERSLRQYRDILVAQASRGELKRTGTSRPELLLMQRARQVFPDGGFIHSRPSWLLGRNGKPLELDIYSDRLNVAIEVQGPHHSLPIHGHERLLSQQDRDLLKQQRCRERGVALFIVDAAALLRNVLTLSPLAQADWLTEMIRRTREEGVYEWPSS